MCLSVRLFLLSKKVATVYSRVSVGKRLGGGEHFVDVVAEKAGRRLIISLKWQQVSGTAEQKVPFKVIRLEEA